MISQNRCVSAYQFVVACCAILFVFIAIISGVGINSAYAHCKGKHSNYAPHCGGGEDPPPPPDPDGSADPQVVYRDGGIYLANDDGTSQTEIRTGGVEPKLDAPGKRVLFYDYPSLGNLNYLGLIPYTNDGGNIVFSPDQILLDTADISTMDISGRFSSFGLLDWSQGGDKYAYTIRQDYGDGLGWRYKIMVSPGGTSTPMFAEHTVAWDGAPDGGMGSAAWDASGDYIYLFEEFNLGLPQTLLVIDITTNPGTVVKSIDLEDWIGDTGFAPESNPQGLSASYQTGGTTGSYSFDPTNVDVPPKSDTSLCLMIPLVDWGFSNRHEARFTMVFDLPYLFDPVSGLSCSLMTTPTATIIDFGGDDFTTGDAGIVGRDWNKRPYGGISIYNLADDTRTRIIGDGGFSDWSN